MKRITSHATIRCSPFHLTIPLPFVVAGQERKSEHDQDRIPMVHHGRTVPGVRSERPTSGGFFLETGADPRERGTFQKPTLQ